MITGNSRRVVSNQNGPHENLLATVLKHKTSPFRRPISDRSRMDFEGINHDVQDAGLPIIFDSGCGTGESSRQLATEHPDCFVIGVDKSSHRLTKEYNQERPDNLLFVQADLVDFYILAAEANWRVVRHYILYPNPWPKSTHLQRRWHGSPVFPMMLSLGGMIELRTNWRLYADEFAAALGVFGVSAHVTSFTGTAPFLTLFEKKYAESDHDLFKVSADIPAGLFT